MERATKSSSHPEAARPAGGSVAAPRVAGPLLDVRPSAAAMRELANSFSNSPRLVTQRKLSEAIDQSPRISNLRALGAAAQASPRVQLQRGKSGAMFAAARLQPESLKPTNNTGLPDALKLGVESLSGVSLDSVKVHYNSGRPAQLNALAFAQGNEIHVGPGQQQHLPHEAWHVVQQAQGRVQATAQMKGGVPVNDDAGLEAEADAMGARALAAVAGETLPSHFGARDTAQKTALSLASSMQRVVQAEWMPVNENMLAWDALRTGVRWFFDKRTTEMSFEIEDREAIAPEYAVVLDELKARKLSYPAWMREWNELGWIHPSPGHKAMFSTYADRIVKTYPPGQYIYIGMGASCDLVLEYIQRKYGIESINIPISSANENPPQGGWSVAQLGRLHDYIARTVGETAIHSGKRLLVMDVTSGGSSLKNISEALEEVLRRSGKNPGLVERLSLNTMVRPDRQVAVPRGGADAAPPLLEAAMARRDLTERERQFSGAVPQSGVVRRGDRWVGETVFDEVEQPEEARGDQSGGRELKEELSPPRSGLGAEELEEGSLESIGEQSGEESDEEPEETPSHLEYEPSAYDAFVAGADHPVSVIGKKLDDMDYKKMGRRFGKIKMTDVMSGAVTTPDPHYDRHGHARVRNFAARLLE
jgi:hypothetical protein